MFRKMLTAAIAVTALLLSTLALNASATGACSYANATAYNSPCADPLAYPGPFTGEGVPQASFGKWGPYGPYGFGGVAATAAAPAAGGGGAAGGGAAPLAVTGSESTVLGYVGTGLIAFGAVAMGSRRKFFQGALD